MEKLNDDLKEKYSSLLSVKNTLENDLLTIQSFIEQEKSTSNNLIERLNEIEGNILLLLLIQF